MQKTPIYNLILFFIFTSFCKSDTTIERQDQALKSKKQNILFIAVDDLRPLINSYGASLLKTPNIDKLAKEGVQFNSAYTNVPVCGGSRASIMTGVRPGLTRFTNFKTNAQNDLPDALPLHGAFKNEGYQTLAYGKIFHVKNDFAEHWSSLDKNYTQNDYKDPLAIERFNNAERGEYGKKGVAFEAADVPDDAYSDGKITKKAIRKLKQLKKSNTPFFMAIGYVSPHLPFIQPKKYWDMYDHETLPLADNEYPPINAPDVLINSQHNSNELRKNYLDIPADGLLGEELSKNLVHGYLASVSYMDALIGDLMANLDALGLRENTTVILWSDHGYFLGEHTFWCKHSTLHEGVQIPLIISAPGYTKNQTTESFAELVDVYPTLCELAGITPPSYLHGQSLVPILENPETEVKNEIYTRYIKGETVLDKNYSYTEFVNNDGDPYQNVLFDMIKDKKQNTDISDVPANAKLVEKYQQKLQAMRIQVNNAPF
ncbi:sulfatase [Flavobacteriaceae bacterium]|nr:sulfatase [Flavobacteriaceae bacterium]